MTARSRRLSARIRRPSPRRSRSGDRQRHRRCHASSISAIRRMSRAERRTGGETGPVASMTCWHRGEAAAGRYWGLAMAKIAPMARTLFVECMRSASAPLPCRRSLPGRPAKLHVRRGPAPCRPGAPWQLGAVRIGQAAPRNAPASHGLIKVLISRLRTRGTAASIGLVFGSPIFLVSMATKSQSSARSAQRYEASSRPALIEGDPSQIDLRRSTVFA